MPLRAVVRRSSYRDSMVLMRVAEAVRVLPGVREAAVLMGTPANHELLASAGLATTETKDAAPGDLMIAVLADTESAAEAGLAEAERVLAERRASVEPAGRSLPRTLDGALRQMPDANLAAISVPGEYAAFEAQRALRRGLHVFLFSDNVTLEDEIALKRLAVERGLLCMGPDCGTAYIGGVGLGFANVVPRGRVGCVAASGTGLQAVVARLAALGEGVSHAIGVGGRDLSAEVGGAMTVPALEALAADATTEIIVVIGKPAAPEIVPRLETAIARIAKPVVVCCLGATPAGSAAGRWVSTLEDAAELALATLRGQTWSPRMFTDPADVRARLPRARGPRGTILGLYTGGTLAHEAGLVLAPLVGADAYRLVDLGGDEFTRGRPHPMIDPSARAAHVRQAGESGDVGVLLVDLVLGRAVHPDPATPLAEAIYDARRAAAARGRELGVVASVVGTDGDPQDLRRQTATLQAAGVEVLPSNAQAARFAALLIRPDLDRSLLGS
ncbi:MAG TPA: acyl-CoA synthetase FdrA [Candidatus Acidoferrum sp.]|nr:acyl-CoA synthetase FdrA [Candidatus Acidoferrum sp.]